MSLIRTYLTQIESQSISEVKEYPQKVTTLNRSMRATGRGRGIRGRGSTSRKNLITTYTKTNQQEKKQRIENKNMNDNWEEISEIQQNEQFDQHYSAMKENLEMMMEDKEHENDNEEISTGPSIGTIGDRTINSTEDKFSKAGG